MNIHDMRKKRLETMRAHPERFRAEDRAWLEQRVSRDQAPSKSPVRAKKKS